MPEKRSPPPLLLPTPGERQGSQLQKEGNGSRDGAADGAAHGQFPLCWEELQSKGCFSQVWKDEWPGRMM